MPELVLPSTQLYAAWCRAREDWGPGVHEDGFGLRPEDDTVTVEGFAAWLDRLAGEPGDARWIMVDGEVAGAIGLRAADDPTSARHGHVGYGVRPSWRGRGLATWALGQALDLARGQGRADLLVVCERDNDASARVIERNGGRLVEVDARVRRYRIDLDPR